MEKYCSANSPLPLIGRYSETIRGGTLLTHVPPIKSRQAFLIGWERARETENKYTALSHRADNCRFHPYCLPVIYEWITYY